VRPDQLFGNVCLEAAVSICVLVAEDEAVVRSLAVDVLTDAGYETLNASGQSFE
jgi:CheY-like chemotaxis protein